LIPTLVFSLLVALPADAQKKKKKKGYTGTGAGIGALLGLALGDGNILEDVARGAAVGAAGGAIASAATRDKRERQYAEEQAAEEARQQSATATQQDAATQARLAEQQTQLAELQRELQEVVSARNSMQEDIVVAIGPDNWEGYKALRACQHARALALAGAGATSSNVTHQLASIWLEAMVAIDGRESAKAEKIFERVVAYDPEIDTVQQASLATDQAVLDMRSERREIGISPCQ